MLFALMTWLTLVLPFCAANAQSLLGNIFSFIVLANTTAVPVVTGAHQVNGVEVFNNGASIAYLKLYDAATATCGTGTPKARYLIPATTGGTGSGAVQAYAGGDRYLNGIVACVTGGIADADTTAPAGTTFIYNIHWQ